MEKTELFPISKSYTFLSSCGVSPLCQAAYDAEISYATLQLNLGSGLFIKGPNVVKLFRESSAALLNTKETNIAFTKSCAEGLNLIASGYPFQHGDEVITYIHEYPSNMYPWELQQNRGVVIKKLPNRNILQSELSDMAQCWTMDDLKKIVSTKTKVVALSHVQFHSGFGANLEELSDFCNVRGIDLVLDVAQSLGAMPIDLQKINAAAVVSSGWKWLTGPLGSAILYVSKELRDRLNITMAGPDMVKQGDDYLNHTWDILDDARRYEYSTTPFGLAHALDASIREFIIKEGVQNIWRKLSKLQEQAIYELDKSKCIPLVFPNEYKSGILSLKLLKSDPLEVVKKLFSNSIICSSRGGYLRIAPHCYVGEEEFSKAISFINSIL